MKMSVLNKKQVISIQDGQILGKIVDFEYEPQSFKIESFCIKKKCNFLTYIFQIFLNDLETVIKTERIVSVGNDVVLVDCAIRKKKNK